MLRNTCPIVRSLMIAVACLAPCGCNWLRLPKMLDEPGFRPESSELSKNVRNAPKGGERDPISPTGTALSGRGSEIERNLGL